MPHLLSDDEWWDEPFFERREFWETNHKYFFDHQIRQLCNIKRRIIAYNKINLYLKMILFYIELCKYLI